MTAAPAPVEAPEEMPVLEAAPAEDSVDDAPEDLAEDTVAEAVPGEAMSANTPVDAPPTEARRMRVLAAEDNKTNQLVFSKMVKTLDIELRFANNGEEAVAGFAEFQPDLIFMDISMPKMDGKEATRAIRAREAETGGHVPILALTAHALDGDSEEILSAGLDRFMTKPLRKAEIHGAIAEYCPEGALPPLPVAALDQPAA